MRCPVFVGIRNRIQDVCNPVQVAAVLILALLKEKTHLSSYRTARATLLPVQHCIIPPLAEVEDVEICVVRIRSIRESITASSARTYGPSTVGSRPH